VTQVAAAVRGAWGRGAKPALARLAIVIGVLLAPLVLAKVLTTPQYTRLSVLAVAALLILGLAWSLERRLLYAILLWLSVLGLARRLLDMVSQPSGADPLLLIGPLAMLALVAIAAERGAFRRRTRLASAVLALNVLTILGAFNPLQGSLTGGLAGLLFVLIPTLAFWVGRSLVDDRTLGLLFRFVAVLAVVAAAYGLLQTFSGFPSWDSAWIGAHKEDFGGLLVNDVPRAFASFTAPSEYGIFLAIGLIVWVAFGFRAALPLTAAATAALGVAIWYEGSRGVIVGGVIALAVIVGAWRGWRPVPSVAVAAVLVLMLPFAVSRLAPEGGSGSSVVSTSPFAARQIAGLSNPTNSKVSTFNAHLDLVRSGLTSVIHDPLGKGTGVITIAGAKYGGSQEVGTEADPSNAALAFGLPGLIAYLVILVAGLGGMYRMAVRRRDALSLVALGILVVTGLQWLNGGNYAVAFLPWLVLGWMDRSRLQADEPPAG
jgi:hypothetical protein